MEAKKGESWRRDFGCVTRFAEWFCVRPSFLFSPSPLPHLKSPLPWPLRKAWYSGYCVLSLFQAPRWWWKAKQSLTKIRSLQFYTAVKSSHRFQIEQHAITRVTTFWIRTPLLSSHSNCLIEVQASTCDTTQCIILATLTAKVHVDSIKKLVFLKKVGICSF